VGNRVIGRWSAVIGHWSLVIGHRSSVIGHWSMVRVAIRHSPSAIRHPPSAIRRPPSAFHLPPSAPFLPETVMRCSTPPLLLITAALLWTSLSGCRRAPPPAVPPKPLSVFHVLPELREVIEEEEFTGRLEAVERIELRSRVSRGAARGVRSDALPHRFATVSGRGTARGRCRAAVRGAGEAAGEPGTASTITVRKTCNV